MAMAAARAAAKKGTTWQAPKRTAQNLQSNILIGDACSARKIAALQKFYEYGNGCQNPALFPRCALVCVFFLSDWLKLLDKADAF
ncbi:MAG TPA: hypothetical protein VFB72_17860 [Verrucomicrobiae bacterium]|nr:hypothetical protein [Verrucomicrobiae bacterium]